VVVPTVVAAVGLPVTEVVIVDAETAEVVIAVDMVVGAIVEVISPLPSVVCGGMVVVGVVAASVVVA